MARTKADPARRGSGDGGASGKMDGSKKSGPRTVPISDVQDMVSRAVAKALRDAKEKSTGGAAGKARVTPRRLPVDARARGFMSMQGYYAPNEEFATVLAAALDCPVADVGMEAGLQMRNARAYASKCTRDAVYDEMLPADVLRERLERRLKKEKLERPDVSLVKLVLSLPVEFLTRNSPCVRVGCRVRQRPSPATVRLHHR